MILGILPRRRDGDDIALALVAIHQHLTGQLFGLAPDHLVRLFFQPAVGILLVIDGIAFPIAKGIDEHHLPFMAEHGVESLGTEIEAPGLARRRFVVPLEGQDIGIFGGQIRRQQIIGLQAEGHLLAIRQGQSQAALAPLQGSQVIGRDGDDAILAGPHLVPIGGGGPRRDRMPLAGHQIAGRHQTRHQHRQRRIFHQLHLFNSFLNGFT